MILQPLVERLQATAPKTGNARWELCGYASLAWVRLARSHASGCAGAGSFGRVGPRPLEDHGGGGPWLGTLPVLLR